MIGNHFTKWIHACLLGFALAIVKRILSRHGGRVTFGRRTSMRGCPGTASDPASAV